jgi:Bacterial extracellular solute-binding protein
MKTTTKAIVTLVLLASFGGAAYYSFRQTSDNPQDYSAGGLLSPVQAVELNGFIALDVEPYFKDPRVIQALANHKIKVTATRVGSRDMAAKVVPGAMPDFFFPSGVVAANQIGDAAKTAKVSTAVYSPFYTPMVIASWTPVAKVLAANGIAQEMSPKVWNVDFAKLTQLMLDKKRWKDLKESQLYPVGKSVLVSTTDVRKSNSAAMYLALTSYAINGGDIVTDKATAQKVAQRSAELFKRQGYQENYVNGNFDDYASIGMGKTPMAFIYENQLVSYALQKKGIGADMVLLYPQPTIFNKVVFVSTSERAKALGELLANDAELQRIAVDYGFRIGDSAYFAQTVKPTGLAIEERITQVIDPPSFDTMAEMIEVIAREMGQ